MTTRRFSPSQRAALFLAADGKCSECGAVLEPGLHADHMQPWSRGGDTDVINGQALCAPCNLRKGNTTVSDLRPWQEAALAAFLRSQEDFLAVATPGAGKTTFALVAAQRLMELGHVQRLLVVVPTSHLRSQWSHAASNLGVQLDHRFVNGAGAVAKDFDGLVVTYSAVASEAQLFRKLASDQSTLIILDEVHHGGDELTWGTALRTAFEAATRRLLLSGTPTRSDGAAIPFVQYNEQGNFLADYTYDYGTAIQDHAVRPTEFLALDGSVRWREAGRVVSTELRDADDDTLANALKSALNPDGDWIASVLRRADAELTRHRSEVPDAGGLVVAADQYRAGAYARILRGICGEEPTLAITDEPNSSEKIAAYAKSNARWIVAVQMVSEGVDIPRLAVGVYASRVRTELFFQQVVGRFVRMRSLDDETTATLLVPSIEPLLRYAQRIERIVDRALKHEEESLRDDIKDREQQQPLQLDLVEPLDSSEATHHSTILAGETFTDEELHRAQAVLEMSGMPGSVTASHMARALRAAGAGRTVGTATITPQQAPVRTLADEKASLRRLVKKKVGRLHKLTEAPYGQIHGQLNRVCGDNADTATADTLQQRLTILEQWIEDA